MDALQNDCSGAPPQIVTLSSDQEAAVVAANTQPILSVSSLQFIGLFTPAEQAAIVNSTDPGVKLFTLQAIGAGTIEFSNPLVTQGLAYAVSIGLLTSDRQAQILAGTPAPT